MGIWVAGELEELLEDLQGRKAQSASESEFSIQARYADGDVNKSEHLKHEAY